MFLNGNGTITFGPSAGYASGSNVDLSAYEGPSLFPMIAPLWDSYQSLSNIQRQSIDVDLNGIPDMVIRWFGLEYTSDNSPFDEVTFQAVLFDDGKIRFNYRDLDSYPQYNAPNPDGDTTVFKTGGINATVGIWKGGSTPVDAVTIPAGTFVPGPHSVSGDSEGAGSGESNDSYVRMAWDTGGAAWDIGVVASFGIVSDASNALRDAFITSLAKQINVALAIGKVAYGDEVVAAYNIGGGAIAAEGFDADPFPNATNSFSTSLPIETTSNSIPEVGSPATKADNVFQTARRSTSGDLNLSFSTLPSGAYVVELFFARISISQPIFNILLEGKTVLILQR